MSIKSEYSDIFAFSDEILSRTCQMGSVSDRSTVNNVVVLYHIVRATSLFKAIKLLCESGYASEAKILKRSLLNLYINISWILKENTAARLLQYFEMDKVYRYKAVCNTYANKRYPDAEKTPEVIAGEKEVEEILSRYGFRDIKSVRNWAKTSIGLMAKEAGLEWEYDVMYFMLSDADHTGPISVEDYYDGKGHFVLSPRDHDVPTTMIFSIEYLLGTECGVRKYFNQKFTDVTRDLLYLESLCVKYRIQ